MMSNEVKIQPTTIYLGNTRAVSNEILLNYCSKFGFVVECSRRLFSLDQEDLVDFTFVRFLTESSTEKFLSINEHRLDDETILDVRPFNEIVHTAVPLQVDRKILVRHVPNAMSNGELKKFFKTFGPIKQMKSDDDENDRRSISVEFESVSSKNKLVKENMKIHRINNYSLKILSFLRPTDVNLYKVEDENSNSTSNVWHELENEYLLNIRDDFVRIDGKIDEFLCEQRERYRKLAHRTRS